MRRPPIAFLTAASLVAAGAAAQSPGRNERPATISYGSDKAQQLDLHRARGTAGAAPLILFVQVLFVTMVYGPIAAFLVEAFPARIRYTSLSLPYHFGNGWFGGFLPLIATAVTTSAWAKETLGSNAIYMGLAYPILVCIVTLIIGGTLIHETKDHRLEAGPEPH